MKRKRFVVSLLLAGIFASTLASAAFAWKTPGFWKNKGYRDFGPYPDDLFEGILVHDSLGGGTLTGAFAYDVLWMNKATGDATKILAFQLIAAILNVEYLVPESGLTDGMELLIEDAIDALNAAGGIGADPEPGTAERDLCIYLAGLLDDLNNDMPWPGYW